MDRIENSIHMGLKVCLQKHIKGFRCIVAYGWGILKRILTYLYCAKYNEITACHSDKQKHAFYEKWYK